MISAMSSRLAMMRSNQRRKICARSFGNVFAQGPKARCAASMAPIVSASPKRGVLASTAPVAGLAMGRVPSPTHFPSTRHWLFRSEGSASFMGRASRVGAYIVKRAGDGEAEFWVSGRGLPGPRKGPGNRREDRKHDKASGHGLDEMVGRESREPALADPEISDRLHHDRRQHEQRDKAYRHPCNAEESRPHPVGEPAGEWRDDSKADWNDRELESRGDGVLLVATHKRE